ncbi:EF-hand domain-containing protein [Sphingomonas sp. MMS24-J45]|uniref:EF-hand domain-containing protein n=1 Tax=Sphingomonas sp. MMS24-J45 TaxID=3238806 RepID=UPI00385032BC
MANWVLALALLQAAAPAPSPSPQVHSEPLAGQLPPLDAPDARGPERFRPRGPLFISPMGEPVHEPNPVHIWFDHADANHDGVVTQAEFIADADRFFLVLDRGHDGEIDPDDIDYYETVLAPEIRSGGGGGAFARGGGRHGGRGGGKGGGGRGGGGEGGHRGGGGGPESGADGGGEATAPPVGSYDASAQGAARFGFFAFPEPVTAADANLNRGVDIREFRAAAEQRFASLDKHGDGRLTFDELPKLAPAGAGGHRPGGPGGRRGGAMPSRDGGE